MTASEMAACYLRGRDLTEEAPGWACSQLENGRDTPSLRILAGEGSWSNWSEIRMLLDCCLEELGFDTSALRKDVTPLVSALLRDMLQGLITRQEALDQINSLYWRFPHEKIKRFLTLRKKWAFLRWKEPDLEDLYGPEIHMWDPEVAVDTEARNWLAGPDHSEDPI